jgi:hypothetical protein
MIPFVPPPPQNDILSRLPEMSIAQLINERAVAQLQELIDQIDADVSAGRPADSTSRLSAELWLMRVQQALRHRPMVIRLTRFDGDTHWHVDFSRNKTTGFRPGQWNSDGHYISVPDAQPGGIIYLTCDTAARFHSATTAGDLPCAPDTRASLRMLSRAGTIVFGAGFEVRYEITEGWPQWPPQEERNRQS